MKCLHFRISKILIEPLVMLHINHCYSLYNGIPTNSTKLIPSKSNIEIFSKMFVIYIKLYIY